MLGNFSYYNPTKLYFGDESLNFLKDELKNWMLEIGLPLTISELGATEDMIPGITEGTICYPAGYMDLKPEDITEILQASMK